MGHYNMKISKIRLSHSLVSRWRGFCKVPVDGRELSRHDKIVLVAMQKPPQAGQAMTACATAGSPIDLVTVAGLVTEYKI